MIRRLAAAEMALVAVLAILATPAAAVVRPQMNIDVTYLSDGHKVCADGALPTEAADANVAGSWSFNIVGTTDNYSSAGGGRTFGTPAAPVCHTVPKNGTPQGGYLVRFAYLGTRVDTDTQNEDPIPWTVNGVGIWRPTDNQFIVG